MLTNLYELMQGVRNLDAVTVCRCGEYALGGGLELAMSCDFRVATEDAALGLPEIDAGLVTGIQGGLLVRLVGLQAAKEIVYTGEPVSGLDAEELGLVNRAVAPDAYVETVDHPRRNAGEQEPAHHPVADAGLSGAPIERRRIGYRSQPRDDRRLF